MTTDHGDEPKLLKRKKSKNPEASPVAKKIAKNADQSNSAENPVLQSRHELKELKQARRAKKPNFELSAKAKKIWEKLRRFTLYIFSVFILKYPKLMQS